MNTIDKQPERHEIEVLLPWYAAGTLSRCDADLVERALARDSELARRYDLVRQERAETNSAQRGARRAIGARHGEAVRRIRC
jgi:anti-sigma-K factor RskA